jgi:CheY-like chemotaxis protein
LDANDPFRVVLIDMAMPNMDVETLGQMIREDPRTAGIPLVIMTTPDPLRPECPLEELGFDAQVPKPVRHAQLKSILCGMLAGRAEAAASARPDGGEPESETAPSPVWNRPARILLAEDNADSREVVLELLRNLGLSADMAANGIEVIRILETANYELVLMDVQMPEMDGFEATRRIRDPRSNVRDHHVPIIAVTAYAMPEDRERCLAAGMNDYLAKPISLAVLKDALARWLSRDLGAHGN